MEVPAEKKYICPMCGKIAETSIEFHSSHGVIPMIGCRCRPENDPPILINKPLRYVLEEVKK